MQKEENPNVGSTRVEKGGRGGEMKVERGETEYREKKNDQLSTGGGEEAEGCGGEWCGGLDRLRNLAQLRAEQTGRDARPTNRAFLIANTRSLDEFPVHPQASIHPDRSSLLPSLLPSLPPSLPSSPFLPSRAIYCEEFRFPFPLFFRQRDHLQIGGG